MAKSPSSPPDSAPKAPVAAEPPAAKADAPAPAAAKSEPKDAAPKAAAPEPKPATPPAAAAPAPAKEAAPVQQAAPTKEAAPAQQAAPAKEAAPVQQAAPAKEAAPEKKAPATPAPTPKAASKPAGKAEPASPGAKSAPKTDDESNAGPKLPPQFRELAEQNVERAKKAYEQYVSTTERMLNTIEDTTRFAWSGARDVNLRMLAFADANAKAGFDYAERFVRAKDLKEIAQLQRDYLQQSTERLAQQMREIQDLASQAAKDALKAANPKA